MNRDWPEEIFFQAEVKTCAGGVAVNQEIPETLVTGNSGITTRTPMNYSWAVFIIAYGVTNNQH
jgi:hypothetical protein